ncbi:MAG: putative lipid II flippase FtsW [Actinobacteria bacterium]|nr:putative lipid II flippase FtsW [Actinomycetota bacterium]
MENRTALFARPASAYYLILGSLSILSALGLVMVLSASSVKALSESGNSFAIVIRQALFLVISAFLAWLAMNLKESLWLPQARLAIFVAAIFLVLPQVPGLGKEVGGNRNWIAIGSFSIQPSEFAKLGLILWCAYRLRIHDKRMLERGTSNPLPLVAPGIGIVLALVMWGDDLGTAAVIAGIVGGILFIAGMQARYFATLSALGIVGFAAFILTSPNRLGRFSAFWDPFSEENYKNEGWQQAHSILGLASGGPLGTGLGSSKQKWGNLPEAHTDFIFSVIGEELGLLGTLTVLILYAILILGIFRVALRARNNFDRYVTGGIGCWIAVQVIMNIGTVISVMPVVGVTLPFISYGGSSLIATFIAIGYVLGVLRRDPEIAAELKARKVARSARG